MWVSVQTPCRYTLGRSGENYVKLKGFVRSPEREMNSGLSNYGGGVCPLQHAFRIFIYKEDNLSSLQARYEKVLVILQSCIDIRDAQKIFMLPLNLSSYKHTFNFCVHTGSWLGGGDCASALAPGSKGPQIRIEMNILSGKTVFQHCTVSNY